MKTNIFKKSKDTKNSAFIEMSKNEQKSIQGGGSIALVTDENGNTRYVYYK